MSSVILTHLGESVPLYIKDCVHQIRLWSDIKIYVILEPVHKMNEFWTGLVSMYSVILVFTDTLQITDHHTAFRNGFQGDTKFRKGYWKHVKERFFYIEELMARDSLEQCVSMEYDVLIYMDLNLVIDKLKKSFQTLRFVRDNDERGHPAFLYCPTVLTIREFNLFLVKILDTPLEDMQALAAYAHNYPEKVRSLPVLTNDTNFNIRDRISKCGHTVKDPGMLSLNANEFGFLFDSLVVGQWVGGIDSRNMRGKKVSQYENESAVYTIHELGFSWKKDPNTFLWKPYCKTVPLVMIHVHSKSLASFMSDRSDYPKDDYDVSTVYKSLLPN